MKEGLSSSSISSLGGIWNLQPHTGEGWAVASAASHRCWQEATPCI